MANRSTDFYLNLDRWEVLSSIERHRGLWEARMEGPAARLEPIRRDALVEAAWSVASPESPLDGTVREQVSGATLPAGPNLALERAWRYYRAAQFVHGWYSAFRWTEADIAQLCRVLSAPADRETGRAASALLSLRTQAFQISQQMGRIPLLELAAFYGGLRRICQNDGAHSYLYLLGFRLLLLQAGCVQVFFGPLETAWFTRGDGYASPPPSPFGNEPTEDLEKRLGSWLDELVLLLLDVGKRAETLWTRTQLVSSRSSLQETILSLAHRTGRITAGDILQETGANRNTVKDNLARLVRQGRLERKGTKRGTVYLPV